VSRRVARHRAATLLKVRRNPISLSPGASGHTKSLHVARHENHRSCKQTLILSTSKLPIVKKSKYKLYTSKCRHHCIINCSTITWWL
jgi:hypothetical protein